jgi:hypothetical protein
MARRSVATERAGSRYLRPRSRTWPPCVTMRSCCSLYSRRPWMVRIVHSMSDAAGDTPRSARRRRVPGVVIAGGLVAILGLVTAVAYVPIRWRQHDDGLLIRPTGIPASVPTRTADLMQLSPALTACIREFRAVKPGRRSTSPTTTQWPAPASRNTTYPPAAAASAFSAAMRAILSRGHAPCQP